MMLKKYGWLICIAAVMVFVAASCSGATTSTSVGGAQVEMGYEVNEDLSIRSAKTSFEAGEEFYVSCDNNAPFGADQVALRAEYSDSGEVVGEAVLDVDPEHTIMSYGPVFFDEPGKYKFSFIVDGRVRASQEVIIRQ